MNYTELQDAISRFSVEDNLNERKPLYALRNEFVKNFSRAKIERMTIDDYVEGKEADPKGLVSFLYRVSEGSDRVPLRSIHPPELRSSGSRSQGRGRPRSVGAFRQLHS